MGGGDHMKCNLKYIRKQKQFDLSQKELAEKLGVTIATIVNIEKGMSCRLETVSKLLDLFQCEFKDLFGNEKGDK
jgi:DNA-binding XRE family transcriptional regulator